MHWYKKAQLTDIQEETKQVSDNDNLPPIDNEDYGNNDSNRFEPDDKMRMILFDWSKSSEINDMKKYIAELVLTVEPQIRCVMKPVNTYQDISVCLGSAHLNISYFLKESDIDATLMEMNLKQKVLQSSLDTLLNVDKMTLMRYLESSYFMDFLLYCVAKQALRENKNFCNFKMYETSVEEHNELIVKELEKKLSFFKITNPDFSKIKYKKNNNIDQICHDQVYVNNTDGLTCVFHGVIVFDFELPTWKFEQNDNSVFESLDEDSQMKVIYSLYETFERETTSDELFEDINIESNSYGEFMTRTYFDPPEVPDFDLHIDPENINIDLNFNKFCKENNFSPIQAAKVIKSIPKDLMNLFKQEINGPDVTDDRTGAELGTKISFDLQDFSLSNTEQVMNVLISVDADS